MTGLTVFSIIMGIILLGGFSILLVSAVSIKTPEEQEREDLEQELYLKEYRERREKKMQA
ncbi:hypothetical protein ACP5WL_29185 [Enterocloster bolteae]|uniref:hypothetical protein n=1 Tax=Lachnospiraceae TaxID=186803 RepID=UPI000E43183C|nr:hypothetical protein [Hungatella hathewayi]RGO68088.1 hypothetical protein DXB08_23710 [Hungatella hathewayi]